ncbi:hypothetical protein [Bradyrhizobium sp. SZCCHNRI2010]|uniref:hypothetical protein n=1 Tax=Bradyrhizobium sp. SZCCHNRI2010 TaxID=3057283 RepID=UPI0028E4E28B|nr:hypothetical protein [Bradyrhizobium sp. SZCCHNRI2010]
MEPSSKQPWWEKVFGLPEHDMPPRPVPDLSLPPDPPPPAPSPEQLALERLIREQQKANVWLALQPVLQHPFRTIMGLIMLYIIVHIWLFG